MDGTKQDTLGYAKKEGREMKVKELIDYLEKCNPEAVVYLGEALKSDAEELDHIAEIGCCDLVIPTVYLY